MWGAAMSEADDLAQLAALIRDHRGGNRLELLLKILVRFPAVRGIQLQQAIDLATAPTVGVDKLRLDGATAIGLTRESGRAKRDKKPCYLMLCDDCGINYADPPSRLCPGCEAYRDHCA